MKPQWESLVGKLGLQAQVKFLGRVPHEEKVRLLKDSRFLILPSRVEGFGIVVLEAFACRKPALVSQIGALQELVADGVDGFLANPSSVNDWAERMVALFSDQGLASTMGNNGYAKLVERYSIDHVARAVERMYMEMLQENRGP